MNSQDKYFFCVKDYRVKNCRVKNRGQFVAGKTYRVRSLWESEIGGADDAERAKNILFVYYEDKKNLGYWIFQCGWNLGYGLPFTLVRGLCAWGYPVINDHDPCQYFWDYFIDQKGLRKLKLEKINRRLSK